MMSYVNPLFWGPACLTHQKVAAARFGLLIGESLSSEPIILVDQLELDTENSRAWYKKSTGWRVRFPCFLRFSFFFTGVFSVTWSPDLSFCRGRSTGVDIDKYARQPLPVGFRFWRLGKKRTTHTPTRNWTVIKIIKCLSVVSNGRCAMEHNTYQGTRWNQYNIRAELSVPSNLISWTASRQ
jgi:hypothetical protein